MIASFGMALRYSFERIEDADLLDKAIAATLDKGLRTADIAAAGAKTIGTSDMGDAIVAELNRIPRLKVLDLAVHCAGRFNYAH